MANQTLSRRVAALFTAHDAGTPAAWSGNYVDLPVGRIEGKQFLGKILGMTGCEISINSLPPGGGMSFWHAHTDNEEVYIFLSGQGQMQIDDTTLAVGAGSFVRIAPAAARIWRNTGAEPLVYLVLQVREGSLQHATISDGRLVERPVVWAGS